MLKINKCLLFVSLVLASGVFCFSQTPPEEKEVVVVEEIKLNVSVFNSDDDEFVPDLDKRDLIIVEDGRLQQASSARRVAANVLIVLDTGGAMRSNLSRTRAAAKNLVKSLGKTDNVSIFQYGDKVEMLTDWTSDKTQILDVLDKKLTFGKRSVFNQALAAAVDFFYKMPLENRHLVLITGGTDSSNDRAARDSAAAKLLASDISVHVVSYTNLEQNSVASRKAIFIDGEPKPQRLPEEVVETLPDFKGAGKKKNVSPRDMARMPRLGSITLDRERIKRAKKETNELEAGERFLTQIAEDTSGDLLLPETFDELIEKTALLARVIDSQYVVTYVPKRSLKNSPRGEIRRIEVASKRDGIQAEANRKFIVEEKK